VIVGVLVLVAGFFGLGGEDVEGIKVASFNGQVFGDSKIGKVGVDYYVDLVRDYDLFFLLEIRDKDGSSMIEVCDSLAAYNYSCLVSERAGRSSSKEQVGVIWDLNEVNVSYVYSVDDLNDSFEREPVVVESSAGTFWVVHLKPSNVSQELDALETMIDEDVVLIGDLNADCDYYDADKETHFDSWDWVIGDEVDTTSGESDCAYDRVVARNVDVIGSGVEEIDSEVSDHNLVWVRIGS